jgi:hypothetical protein
VSRVLALLLVLAALLPAAARADGDPASDVLYAGFVFFPFDVTFDASLQTQLTELTVASRQAGLPIKVALIANAYDLGAIGSLWRQPQQYARFLGAELAFLYKGRLLIVMPNGFGFWNGGKPIAKDLALLKSIPIRTGPNGLAETAITAVRELAAQGGRPLPKPHVRGSSQTTDRIVIGLGALALLALSLAVRFRGRLLARRGR